MERLRWGALFSGVVLVVTGVAPAIPARAEAVAPTPAASATPAGRQVGGDGEYIVRFADGTDTAERAATTAALGNRVSRATAGVPGLVARLTAAERARLAADPNVAYIEKNTTVRVADIPPPWGLDRIDQTSLPLSHSYTARQSGAGVKVYVIDTGINAGHADFAGRVAKGRSWVDDGFGTADCHGHGTMVAGTVAGATYGVAKRATLVPVRVLDCSGTGTADQVVAALDWVRKQHRRGQPAVANLSLTGAYSRAENDAVKRLVADGVTVVTAAGNDSGDACQASPGSAPKALNVAASDASDHRAGFSNHGRCVDLYAPGVDVPSAVGDADASGLYSGTSAASPHVAGVAALVLDQHRRWSPAKVSARLLQLSLRDKVEANPPATPNRLLNIAPGITSLSRSAGELGGHQTVTITGRGFHSVSRVLFDGVAGSRVSVRSSTKLTVRTPRHRAESVVNVQVVTGLSVSNRARFAYVARPTVTSVLPDYGPTSGGTTVTISGHRLGDTRRVYFGGRYTTRFTVLSDNTLSVVAPPQSAGGVAVRVETVAGISSSRRDARFTYGRPPTITKLSLASGPVDGGGLLRISGTNLSTVTSVVFGDAAARRLKVISSRRLTVAVPPHAAGTVDVRVRNSFGTSAVTARARFDYLVPQAG